jgi:predicted DNA-binding transcriptional regulator AlpA
MEGLRIPANNEVPFLVGADGAAKVLGVSPGQLRNMNSSGHLPSPVRLGGRVLWRVNELRDWVAAGCPDRRAWESDRDGVWRGRPGLGGSRPYRSRFEA